MLVSLFVIVVNCVELLRLMSFGTFSSSNIPLGDLPVVVPSLCVIK